MKKKKKKNELQMKSKHFFFSSVELTSPESRMLGHCANASPDPTRLKQSLSRHLSFVSFVDDAARDLAEFETSSFLFQQDESILRTNIQIINRQKKRSIGCNEKKKKKKKKKKR